MPVLGCVDGYLHFLVMFMNRLKETEPATLSFYFALVSVLLYFYVSVINSENNIALYTTVFIQLLCNGVGFKNKKVGIFGGYCHIFILSLM
jgi:hypothetical protein